MESNLDGPQQVESVEGPACPKSQSNSDSLVGDFQYHCGKCMKENFVSMEEHIVISWLAQMAALVTNIEYLDSETVTLSEGSEQTVIRAV